jgi:hypothetical protein
MRALLAILGVLMVCVGVVWTLQGLNVLPGSFMTGDIRWAIYGAVLAIAGLGLIVMSRRRA